MQCWGDIVQQLHTTMPTRRSSMQYIANFVNIMVHALEHDKKTFIESYPI